MSREYRQIAFMQEHDADEPLRILDEVGEEAALDYLLQWDNGDGEMRDRPSHGSGDYLYKKGSYIMSYNLRIPYIGLEEVEYDRRNR